MLAYDLPRPGELMSCVGRLCKDYLYLYNSLPQIPTPPLIMAVNIGEAVCVALLPDLLGCWQELQSSQGSHAPCPGDLLVPLSADQLARGRPCPSVRGLAGSIQPPASRAGHERPRRFHNHEDGSTGVFVLLKMPTSAFTRKNLLRDYAEWTLTHND